MNASSEIEPAIDELYAAPREEFVSVRNRLARTLKENGDGDASRRVKALRKPSLPAWAINQVVRERPEEVAQLVDATARARSAALGGDGSALRSATQERGSLIASLTRAAGDALVASGVSSARSHLDQVRDTLLASASAERADLLRRGRLTETLAGAGFESTFGDAAAVALAAGAPDEESSSTALPDLRLERLREQAAEADRRARRLEERAAAAEDEAARARAAASAARAAATAASQEVDDASS